MQILQILAAFISVDIAHAIIILVAGLYRPAYWYGTVATCMVAGWQFQCLKKTPYVAIHIWGRIKDMSLLCLYSYLACFRRLALGYGNYQNSVFAFGLDILTISGVRQTEAPVK